MQTKSQLLADRFVRVKQGACNERAGEESLDPRPTLEPPEPREKKPKKSPRRVFPFKRYKVEGPR